MNEKGFPTPLEGWQFVFGPSDAEGLRRVAKGEYGTNDPERVVLVIRDRKPRDGGGFECGAFPIEEMIESLKPEPKTAHLVGQIERARASHKGSVLICGSAFEPRWSGELEPG